MIDFNFYMNLVDVEKRGIKDGDDVEVFNDRGRIKIIVKFIEDLLRGVVFFYKVFWVRFFGWNVNFFIMDEMVEEYGNVLVYYLMWVEVRKRV